MHESLSYPGPGITAAARPHSGAAALARPRRSPRSPAPTPRHARGLCLDRQPRRHAPTRLLHERCATRAVRAQLCRAGALGLLLDALRRSPDIDALMGAARGYARGPSGRPSRSFRSLIKRTLLSRKLESPRHGLLPRRRYDKSLADCAEGLASHPLHFGRSRAWADLHEA